MRSAAICAALMIVSSLAAAAPVEPTGSLALPPPLPPPSTGPEALIVVDVDANSALRHGIAVLSPISLPNGITQVPHIVGGDEAANVVAQCSADGNRVYSITALVETGLLIGPAPGLPPDRPQVAERTIPIQDSGNTIADIASGSLQKVSFIRVFWEGSSGGAEVILVVANRVAIGSSPSSPVAFTVYRLRHRPIIDGALLYFGPAASWQTNRSYTSASSALEKAFGVKLAENPGCGG